jgi:hypothetical protein
MLAPFDLDVDEDRESASRMSLGDNSFSIP